jgi:hypothetical protein
VKTQDGFRLWSETCDREAHTALADLQLTQDWNVGAAEQSYRTARQLHPNSIEALLGETAVLRLHGWFADALALARRAADTDPLNRSALTRVGDLAVFAGRLDEAAAAYRAEDPLLDRRRTKPVRRVSRDTGAIGQLHATASRRGMSSAKAQPSNSSGARLGLGVGIAIVCSHRCPIVTKGVRCSISVLMLTVPVAPAASTGRLARMGVNLAAAPRSLEYAVPGAQVRRTQARPPPPS